MHSQCTLLKCAVNSIISVVTVISVIMLEFVVYFFLDEIAFSFFFTEVYWQLIIQETIVFIWEILV